MYFMKNCQWKNFWSMEQDLWSMVQDHISTKQIILELNPWTRWRRIIPKLSLSSKFYLTSGGKKIFGEKMFKINYHLSVSEEHFLQLCFCSRTCFTFVAYLRTQTLSTLLKLQLDISFCFWVKYRVEGQTQRRNWTN